MVSVPASPRHSYLALCQLFTSATFTFFSKEWLGGLHVIRCVKVLYILRSAVQTLSIDRNHKVVVQGRGTES